MAQDLSLTTRFEEHRPHLQKVAYRMLGSLPEADDAVQDTWLRVSRAGTDDVENLGGWLTTTTSRICLNMLRTRKRRREEPYGGQLPDPIVGPAQEKGPEEEAEMADSVSLALMVVLDTLTPPERLAFVLHDMFQVPFDEIAPLVERTPATARKMASRARQRVAAADIPHPDPDLTRQRETVDAFYRATRHGDLNALVELLHPDVVLRADYGPKRAPAEFRGPDAVASQSRHLPGAAVIPVRLNGTAGAVIELRGRPTAVMGFTVRKDKIIEIVAISDRQRIERITAPVNHDGK